MFSLWPQPLLLLLSLLSFQSALRFFQLKLELVRGQLLHPRFHQPFFSGPFLHHHSHVHFLPFLLLHFWGNQHLCVSLRLHLLPRLFLFHFLCGRWFPLFSLPQQLLVQQPLEFPQWFSQRDCNFESLC